MDKENGDSKVLMFPGNYSPEAQEIEGTERTSRVGAIKAAVQYGDYKGTVAADDSDHQSIRQLAEKHGVDTGKYFVIGIDIYIGEIRKDRLPEPFIQILAVDKDVVKAASIDYIRKYIAEHEGQLPYLEFRIEASLDLS